MIALKEPSPALLKGQMWKVMVRNISKDDMTFLLYVNNVGRNHPL